MPVLGHAVQQDGMPYAATAAEGRRGGRLKHPAQGFIVNETEASGLSSRFRILPIIWVPLARGVAVGIPGLIALWTHHLILFASLGPTGVMAAQQPLLSSTKPYNCIAGHMIGLGSGFLAVWTLGIASQPSVFTAHAISGSRVCAAVMAIAIAILVESLLRARHPPAASTTLLAALGSLRLDWTYTWEVLAGVVAVTATGELLRMLHPGPHPPGTRPAPPEVLRPARLRH
jgi:CBS domain-containing membrane protein